MRTRLSLFPVLILAFLLLAGCSGKMAVINPDRIFEDSEAMKSGMAYLTNLSQELQDDISASMEGSPGRRGPSAALQQKVSEAQQRYSEEQQRVMGQVNDLFLKALETCRLKGRFSMVILKDAALAYDPATDITRKVVEEMNKTPLTFSPPPSATVSP
ncbi:MAG: OmpH family outer membrane protein [Desulfovibrio sp.]|jgi:Skp family chaperone for outer membrane proteins|nr:OmpH family outer membrane protein [Desulfovibrio sp.]